MSLENKYRIYELLNEAVALAARESYPVAQRIARVAEWLGRRWRITYQERIR